MTMHQTYVQKGQLWKGKKTQVWPFSCLLLSSSSPPQKEFPRNFIITTFLCHGPLHFSTRAPLFASPIAKPNEPCQWISVGLTKHMSLRNLELHGHSHIFIFNFLGVNWSGPRTNSIAKHRSYKAFRQLHGSWCKQPLSRSEAYSKTTKTREPSKTC